METSVLTEVGNNGSAGPPKMSFKFFKNQEIPEFFYNQDTDGYMKEPN